MPMMKPLLINVIVSPAVAPAIDKAGELTSVEYK
jgi:hypothetical protein